jgi:hypothetical protein
MVYEALDAHGRVFAIKACWGCQRTVLEHESEMYRVLVPLIVGGTPIILRYFGYFSHKNFDVIVMEHTGDTIRDFSELDPSDR